MIGKQADLFNQIKRGFRRCLSIFKKNTRKWFNDNQTLKRNSFI